MTDSQLRADLQLVRAALATVLIRGEIAYSVAAVCDAAERTHRNEPMSSGNKYHRRVHGLGAHGGSSVVIDVYSVFTAFAVTSPPLQHAGKKILCAGIRGKGSKVQDLVEARDALDRAIEDARREEEEAKGAAA